MYAASKVPYVPLPGVAPAPALNVPVRLLEVGVAILAMVVYGCIAVLEALSPTASRSVLLPLYALGALLLVAHHKAVGAVAAGSPGLIALILSPVVTILWSVEPAESIQRTLAVIGPSMLGLYLGATYGFRTLLLTFASTFAILGALSIIAIFLVPSIGITTEEEWFGVWRGVFGHKNGLGASASFGAIALIFSLPLVQARWKIVIGAAAAINLLLLAKSESVTAQISFVLSLGALLAIVRARQARLFFIAATGLALALLVAFIALMEFGLSPIVEALGRNANFSNRLPLWTALTDVIAHRPWFGYGYAAFWASDIPEFHRVVAAVRFVPFYSHDGLLELLLDGGAAIALIAFTVLAATLARSLRLARSAVIVSAFPLCFLISFIVGNTTEALFLARNNLLWLEFVAISSYLARTVRLRARAPAASKLRPIALRVGP